MFDQLKFVRLESKKGRNWPCIVFDSFEQLNETVLSLDALKTSKWHEESLKKSHALSLLQIRKEPGFYTTKYRPVFLLIDGLVKFVKDEMLFDFSTTLFEAITEWRGKDNTVEQEMDEALNVAQLFVGTDPKQTAMAEKDTKDKEEEEDLGKENEPEPAEAAASTSVDEKMDAETTVDSTAGNVKEDAKANETVDQPMDVDDADSKDGDKARQGEQDDAMEVDASDKSKDTTEPVALFKDEKKSMEMAQDTSGSSEEEATSPLTRSARKGALSGTRRMTTSEEVSVTKGSKGSARKPRPVSLSGRKLGRKEQKGASEKAANVDSETNDLKTPAKEVEARRTKSASSKSSRGKNAAGQSTSTKKQRRTTSNDDYTSSEQLPTFDQVKPLLQKAGYRFPKGRFCRPTENRNGEDGVDFFDNEQAFRDHLCAHGVNGDHSQWTSEERDLVERWVRYAVVKSAEPGEIVRFRVLSGRDAANLLVLLGFQWHNDGTFILPGVDNDSKIPNVNFFQNERGPFGVFTYLTRHGLPEACDFEGISKEDRLSLELYLTSPSPEDVNTFETKSQDPASPSRRTRSGMRLSQVDERTTSAHPSPDNATLVSNDSLEFPVSTTKKRSGPAKKNSSVKKRRTESASRRRLSSASTESPSTACSGRVAGLRGATVSPVVKSAKKFIDDLIDADETPTCLPDHAQTCGDKLNACLEALKQSYNAGVPTFGLPSDSPYVQNIGEVLSFLHSVADSDGQFVQEGSRNKPPTMYVCGGPGIGKTSGVKWCCDKVAKEYTDKHMHEDNLKPVPVILNASSAADSDCPSSCLSSLVKPILDHLDCRVWSERSIKGILAKRKELLVVVVDEIDLLVSDRRTSELTAAERALKSLCECAADETFPFALIGISNLTGNGKYQRLQSIGEFTKRVNFRRYSESELTAILEARVGKSTIQKGALEFIAKKTSEFHGDARRALELTADAVEDCLKGMTRAKLDTVPTNAFVLMKNVMAVVNQRKKRFKEMVVGLPQYQKVLLAVSTVLAEKAGITAISLGKLKQIVDNLISQLYPSDVQHSTEVLILVDDLVDKGIFSLRNLKKENGLLDMDSCTASSLQVQFMDALQDSADALKEEFEVHRKFYDKIAEEVIGKKHLFEL